MNVIIPDPRSYDRGRIVTLKNLLTEHYYALMRDDDRRATLFPPKQLIAIANWGDEDFSDVRTLSLLGNIPGGVSGGKIIHANETEEIQKAATVIFANGGHELVVVESSWLTNLRCGLMAAIAIERFLPDVGADMIVGLAGLGRINVLTARVLHDLWGVREFVVRGSRRNRAHNVDVLIDAIPGVRVRCDDTPQMEILACTDCVISCTTNNYPDDTARFEWLSNVPLFVAQDEGYFFGQSFRDALPFVSDHPEQHHSHWRDSFPWDEPGERQIQNLAATTLPKGSQVVVYLLGIILADLIVAYEAWVHRG